MTIQQLEESVELNAVQPLMLGVVLRHAVVAAKSRAYLHKLYRR